MTRETPAEGLARLQRMGERARDRRAAAEAEERAQWEAEEREREQRVREEAVALFLAGPPDGCSACYSFAKVYLGAPPAWTWWHTYNINPEVRPAVSYEGADPEPVEHCMCRCHGPDGLPLWVVAIA